MFKLSLDRVRDTVKITEGDETLVLKVDGDAARMSSGLLLVGRKLTDKNLRPEQLETVAMEFAGVIFGAEQAQALKDFYGGSAGCVINVCGSYFDQRLGKLITKRQKKQKRDGM